MIEKLEPALSKLLKGAKKLSDVQKAKNWRPLNKWLKRYTGDLCKFLGAVSEASVISALLKHIHGLVLYFAALPKSAKFLSKQLIHLWSTHEEESVRVLALMAVRKKMVFIWGAFTYDVRCFGEYFDLPTLIRYFTT